MGLKSAEVLRGKLALIVLMKQVTYSGFCSAVETERVVVGRTAHKFPMGAMS
jgi:hypothetical protein